MFWVPPCPREPPCLAERTALVPGAEAVEGDGAIPWRPMLKFQFMRTQDPPPPAAAPNDALQVQLTGLAQTLGQL